MKVYSVTQVTGFYADFSRVKQEVMENAQARGTAVHSACAAYTLGLWNNLQSEYMGYLVSFKQWFDKYVEEVVAVEQEFSDARLGIKGHPDYVLRMRGDKCLSLPDLKTAAAPQVIWRPQLATYKYLVKDIYLVDRVFSLQLDRDGGRPKVREYTDDYTEDLNVFLSMLNVRRWMDAANS